MIKLTDILREVYDGIDKFIPTELSQEDAKKLRDNVIKLARKFNTVEDFKEEFIYYCRIGIDSSISIHRRIKKGEEVQLVYKTGGDEIPYKQIQTDKEYGSLSRWELIMDNTQELQNVAEDAYNKYKNIEKPKIKDDGTIDILYHVSPYKFKKFKYGQNKTSGQIGADVGFFFLKDQSPVNLYIKNLKSIYDIVYVYKCKVRLGNSLVLNGEDIGTNWGRQATLAHAEYDYDSVLIRNADTGMGGLADEYVIFDDDNIEILEIKKVKR